jgi:hypothetical protein
MELMNQFVTAETTKTAAIVIKLSEYLLGCEHKCLDGQFLQFTRAGSVDGGKGDCVGTIMC